MKRLRESDTVTVRSAIYHVVEHFAGHTYQIVYITKMLTGSDLGFYTLESGIPRPTWGHEPAQVESKPARRAHRYPPPSP